MGTLILKLKQAVAWSGMDPLTTYCIIGLVVLWLLWARRWIPNPPKDVPQPKEGVLKFMHKMMTHVATKKDIPLHELLLRVTRENAWKPFGFSRAGPNGWDSVYCVTHPKDIKYVMKENFWNFEKHSGQIEKMGEFLGVTPSIFGTNGDMWKEQRQILATMFSVRQLRDYMADVFGSHAVEMNNALERQLKREPGTAIDMHEMWYCYTFDTSNRIAFKRPVDSIGGVQKDIEFQRAFDLVQEYSMERYLAPWWKITRFMGVGMEKELRQKMDLVNKYIDGVIDEYFESDGSDGISPSVRGDGTVLALFIVHGRREGKNYSRTYLRDLVLTFLLGGRDTTGSTLTTLTYLLCKDEAGLAWQERLAAEADHVFGGTDDNACLSYQDVESVPVCEALLNEVWRCFPPVPTEEKVCMKECTMPQGGHKIQPGTLVYYVPYVTNRHPDFWGPDADSFNPERWWIDDGKGGLKCKTADEYEVATFNAGPRLCLGKYMATLEAKIAALSFARKWKWTLKQGYEPQLKSPCIMIQPMNGMWIHLEPRR